jgi:hypothetical protein
VGNGQDVTVETPVSPHSDPGALPLQNKLTTFTIAQTTVTLFGDILLLLVAVLMWITERDSLG